MVFAQWPEFGAEISVNQLDGVSCNRHSLMGQPEVGHNNMGIALVVDGEPVTCAHPRRPSEV